MRVVWGAAMSPAVLITPGGTVELTGAALQLAHLLSAYRAEISRVRFGRVTFSFGGGEHCTMEVTQSFRDK